MDLRTSEAIRKKWYKMLQRDHVPEWDDREAFTKWCEQEADGRTGAMALRRFDPSRPFGPDNCYLQDLPGYQSGEAGRPDPETVRKWNKTVNVFRRAAGLPLFKEE